MARKKIRIEEDEAELNITSLMDIMTIILVFLLKSYSTEEITVTPSEDLSLPNSTASLKPELAINTVVTKVAEHVIERAPKSVVAERICDQLTPLLGRHVELPA